jgi:hypothetical protein
MRHLQEKGAPDVKHGKSSRSELVLTADNIRGQGTASGLLDIPRAGLTRLDATG